MYTAFYGLREKPFALSPDPRFLYLAGAHREALAHLLYGLEQGEGFIAITGEVGTGKTTLCRTLLERLGAETEVAFLFNPSRNATELLQAIAIEFGLPIEGRGRTELGHDLNRFLLEKSREGRRVLLIIDEAQNLSPSTLEQVRLLSNLETANAKLIHILLLGQPELDRKLDSARLRQLRQRISVRWNLAALPPSETRAYVRHRLRVAAGEEREIFNEAALREIHRRSRGVPRLVNVLCDRALLAGYGARVAKIGVPLVRQAAREIRDTRSRSWLRALWPVAGVEAGRAEAASRAERLTRAARSAALVLAILGASYWAGMHLGSWVEGTGRGIDDTSESTGAVAAAPPAPDLIAGQVATAPGGAAAATADFGAAAPYLYDPAEPSRDPALRVVEGEAFLAGILAARTADEVRRASLNAMLGAYGLSSLGFVPSSDGEALSWLEERGLSVLSVDEATLPLLRALNHPALLRLEADDGVARLVALRELGEDSAALYGVQEAGALQIPAQELDAQWTGEAHIVWQRFEEIPTLLTLGQSGAGVTWLQLALSELGYFRDVPTGNFDASTLESVRALQGSRDLEPDGEAGPRTQMVLYDLLGTYAVPRLGERGAG